jgi:hypothetical protein
VNEISYSTQFNDAFVVMEDCCAAAVVQLQAEETFDYFCHVDEELVPGTEVNFNDEANEGEGVCTLVDGFVYKSYKDADFKEVSQSNAQVTSAVGDTIANRLCCLAYDEDGEINNSFELSFACEEIPFFKETPTYDPETETCSVEQESYIYVDLDANLMYDQ